MYGSYTTPTLTELEAVNRMLSVIGEAPVAQIDSSISEAGEARNLLRDTSRNVQSIGWHFNTETNFPLSPNEDGNLLLPSNTLRVDTDNNSRAIDVVQRGNRLYNRTTHSYTFDKTITVSMVLFLPFSELPEIAKQYITALAGLRFQTEVMGSQVLHMFTQQQAERLLVLLQEYDLDIGDYNMIDNNPSNYYYLIRGI